MTNVSQEADGLTPPEDQRVKPGTQR